MSSVHLENVEQLHVLASLAESIKKLSKKYKLTEKQSIEIIRLYLEIFDSKGSGDAGPENKQ